MELGAEVGIEIRLEPLSPAVTRPIDGGLSSARSHTGEGAVGDSVDSIGVWTRFLRCYIEGLRVFGSNWEIEGGGLDGEGGSGTSGADGRDGPAGWAVRVSVRLSVCPSVRLSVCPSIFCPCVRVSVWVSDYLGGWVGGWLTGDL
eukprot:COSAG02_NODE_15422_length_1172_cov_6.053122_2_plen_145_part_00